MRLCVAPHNSNQSIVSHWLRWRDHPVEGRRENPVGYNLLLFDLFVWHQLVALLPVAATMRKLKVVYVGGVSAFSQGDDVVNSWTEGVGIFQTEVHRFPADSTHGLRRIDPLLILFKLTAMWSVFVKSLPCCHYPHQHKRADM